MDKIELEIHKDKDGRRTVRDRVSGREVARIVHANHDFPFDDVMTLTVTVHATNENGEVELGL